MCMAVLAYYPHGAALHVGVGTLEAYTTAVFPLTSPEQLFPWLEAAGISPDDVDFIVTSGTLPGSQPSGIYLFNPEAAAAHQGVEFCALLAERLSSPVYLIDPASRADCHPQALVTGTPALGRTCSADHFLFKFLARQEAAKRGLPQSEGRFIAAHLDEVHQLGAVVGTKVVDCLTSLEEGPFALRQSGGLPFDGVLELCSQHQGREEVLDALNQNGGLHGYLGLERLEDLFDLQGEQADLVRQALVYQIAKEIGALTAVLEGKVDAVILSGELMRLPSFQAELAQRVGFIAPISVYPGNQGVAALMAGAKRILDQEPIILS